MNDYKETKRTIVIWKNYRLLLIWVLTTRASGGSVCWPKTCRKQENRFMGDCKRNLNRNKNGVLKSELTEENYVDFIFQQSNEEIIEDTFENLPSPLKNIYNETLHNRLILDQNYDGLKVNVKYFLSELKNVSKPFCGRINAFFIGLRFESDCKENLLKTAAGKEKQIMDTNNYLDFLCQQSNGKIVRNDFRQINPQLRSLFKDAVGENENLKVIDFLEKESVAKLFCAESNTIMHKMSHLKCPLPQNPSPPKCRERNSNFMGKCKAHLRERENGVSKTMLTETNYLDFINQQSRGEILGATFDNLAVTLQRIYNDTLCDSSVPKENCNRHELYLEFFFSDLRSVAKRFCAEIDAYMTGLRFESDCKINLLKTITGRGKERLNKKNYPDFLCQQSNGEILRSSFKALNPSLQEIFNDAVGANRNITVIDFLTDKETVAKSFCAESNIYMFRQGYLDCRPISPSIKPSASPTVVPSLDPSLHPSIPMPSGPTVSPSIQPSQIPSRSHTPSISHSPSSTPSKIPSTNPSQQPSFTPSKMSSVKPSQQPSFIPSKIPSGNPSQPPSSIPSKIPSANPSQQSSSVPSKRPSQKPSSVPSKRPSLNPSQKPSSIPSKRPSLNPSRSPSTVPSRIPSVNPSRQPSFIPSNIPSVIPSTSPTTLPTHRPSSIPSSYFPKPSSVPSASLHPSYMPSIVPTMFPFSKEIFYTIQYCGGGDFQSLLQDVTESIVFRVLHNVSEINLNNPVKNNDNQPAEHGKKIMKEHHLKARELTQETESWNFVVQIDLYDAVNCERCFFVVTSILITPPRGIILSSNEKNEISTRISEAIKAAVNGGEIFNALNSISATPSSEPCLKPSPSPTNTFRPTLEPSLGSQLITIQPVYTLSNPDSLELSEMLRKNTEAIVSESLKCHYRNKNRRGMKETVHNSLSGNSTYNTRRVKTSEVGQWFVREERKAECRPFSSSVTIILTELSETLSIVCGNILPCFFVETFIELTAPAGGTRISDTEKKEVSALITDALNAAIQDGSIISE